jgi:hypothetical protein
MANGATMQRGRRIFLTLALAFLMYSAGHGQSLGEVARENRDRQNVDDASPAAKQKVITNKDLPKDPNADQVAGEAPPAASAAADGKDADGKDKDKNKDTDPFLAKRHLAEQRVADQRLAQKRLAQQRAAEQWKRQIVAQQNKMANLQAQIDQLHASIRSASGSVQSEGPYTRSQAQQLQRVAQVQLQLNEQKWKLEQMQEAARHAGMHTAVYDP